MNNRTSDGRAILWYLGCSCAVLLLGVSLRAQEAAPVDFYHDFRKPVLPPELTPFHAEDSNYFQLEPEGLRITLPKTPLPHDGIGLKTTFGLEGDFEVTATVEALHLGPPPSGYGAGVGIVVEAAPQLAYLKRQVTPKGKHIVLWGRRRPDPETMKDLWFQNGPPCTEPLLRLRLKRLGTVLSYWWAPGAAGDNYQELQWSRGKLPFGSEPVQNIRIIAGNGRTDSPLDVRLLDLRIRTLGTPVEPPAPAAPVKTGGKLWLTLLLVAVGAGTALALGAWLLVRRDRRHHSLDKMEAAEISLALTFPCPNCGKGLKARPELVGKKVKCRQCGEAVLVPEAASGDSTDAPL
jgi:hypothetical protein